MIHQKWLKRFELCVIVSVIAVIVISCLWVSINAIGDAVNYEPMRTKNTPPTITKIDKSDDNRKSLPPIDSLT